MNILVVEDSLTQSESLIHFFESEGYKTVLAKNGFAGYELAKKHLPDIILTDILMPIMDGFDMCAKIKADPATRAIPVIVLTTLTEPKDLVSALKAGVDGFHVKPFNGPQLLSLMGRILSGKAPASLPGERTEIFFGAEKISFDSGTQQMFNLLLSTYENAAGQKAVAERLNNELFSANRELESRVRERSQVLQEKQELLNSILEGTTDAIYVKDLQGRYLLFNAAAEAYAGKTAAEVLGQDDSFILPPNEAQAVMKNDKAAYRQTRTYEETVTTAGGKCTVFLVTKGPVRDAGGNVFGLFGVGKDVTGLKSADGIPKKG